MADPTLADVLAQYAAARIGNESTEDTERRLSIARSLALQYVLAKRTALERFELEQAARKAVGAEPWKTVVVAQNSNESPEFISVYTARPQNEPNGVIVGANWKTEVGR